jgi:nucleotide-binding universal stress UspA family protein
MPGIVVGIDGSDHARRALEWAMREAGLRQTPLTVLTVHQVLSGTFHNIAVLQPADQELAKEAVATARKHTQEVLDALDGAGPATVTVTCVSGLPAEALVEASQDVELLVVGSRGAGGFKRLMQGSVSSQVTQHAQCPVVVVPDQASAD